ncbi:MAG TPA: hypothetical protein VNB06_13250 [Thermoanaerobaculia bacterium]|nr:hypothetical protein [Thermoanaerobaculia bacterium]
MEDRETRLPDHPRGTLAIVLIYGLLMAACWGGIYVWTLFGRGAPMP